MVKNIKTFFIFLLIIAVFAGFAYYEYKVSKLQKVLDKAAPPDTIKVEIIQTDTVLIIESDTAIVEIEKVGDTVYVYKKFHGAFDQPLFHLDVWANSRTEKFRFEIIYEPLRLYFEIKDKYDIRKGLNLRIEPDFGIKYSIDWDDYAPARRPKNFKTNLGFGYTKEVGPFILSGLQYKRNALGLFLKEDSWGLYYQRSFDIF